MIIAWVLFYAAFLLFTVLSAFYHQYVIEVKKQSPNHQLWTLYRAAFFTGNAFLFSTELVHLLVLIFHQSALYWSIFDALLNRLRGLPTFYVGKTAAIDKFFADKGDTIVYIKLGLLLLSIALTIMLL